MNTSTLELHAKHIFLFKQWGQSSDVVVYECGYAYNIRSAHCASIITKAMSFANVVKILNRRLQKRSHTWIWIRSLSVPKCWRTVLCANTVRTLRCKCCRQITHPRFYSTTLLSYNHCSNKKCNWRAAESCFMLFICVSETTKYVMLRAACTFFVLVEAVVKKILSAVQLYLGYILLFTYKLYLLLRKRNKKN